MAKTVDKAFQRLTRGSRPARGRVGGPGRYKKGHKKTGGRQKGVPNVFTRELREAILNAAIRHGADGNGEDGLEGYMFLLARTDRKTFGMLLRAVMPTQVNTSVSTLVNVEYKSVEQATAEARALGLPEKRVFELKDYRTQDETEEPTSEE